jgi:replicative superfamily II helicase
MYFDENAQRYGANVATEMAIRNWYKTDPFYIKTVINDFYYGLKKEAKNIYLPKINKLYNFKHQ